MKLSTLVFLFLLALCQWQVSAKPSKEFADEIASLQDAMQEELNLDDIQFEEGELESFLDELVEQGNNPQRVLQQRQGIIQKILQLQQRLQSLVYNPGFQGGLGGLQGFGGLQGSNDKQLQQLLKQLQKGGGNPYGGLGGFQGNFGNSQDYTKLMKQFGKGGKGGDWSWILQYPQLLQNPQLLYLIMNLDGGSGLQFGKGFKLPKAPKTQAASGPQMCWCPCQQANAPTQRFGGAPAGFAGIGAVNPGIIGGSPILGGVGTSVDPFGNPIGYGGYNPGFGVGIGTHSVDPYGNVQDPFGNHVGNFNGGYAFEEVESAEQDIVVPRE
jgi:hypothetical protein